MLKHQNNLTIDSINLGTFDKPQMFHYCVLHFIGVSDVVEQGDIVDGYLKGYNFFLLPRNELETAEATVQTFSECSGSRIYTSLLIIAEDNDNISNRSKMISTIEQLYQDKRIGIQRSIFYKNGTEAIDSLRSFPVTDNDGRYSYLITHRFVDGKFHYRITSSTTFKQHFEQLSQKNLESGTVLDLVFTGRNSNQYHNSYSFNGYKVKDFYIDRDGKVILSNVKGVLDLRRCAGNSDQVFFYNFLVGWFPMFVWNHEYYGGMNIKFINFVSEKRLEIERDKVYIKEPNLRREMFGLVGVIDVILPEDNELRYEYINVVYREGARKVKEIYLASKAPVETSEIILETFYEKVKDRMEKESANARERLVNEIRQLRHNIEDYEERILVLEHRTQNFIPIPEIRLPKNDKIKKPTLDIADMIKIIDGKYILEERGE